MATVPGHLELQPGALFALDLKKRILSLSITITIIIPVFAS